ncbi:MAG TPA: trehalase family glycosidase, partial [Candidatus Omnitrophota bacterium]|nr:trehalase family glycosidase [Candidatus Omnitrophota bacterium]
HILLPFWEPVLHLLDQAYMRDYLTMPTENLVRLESDLDRIMAVIEEHDRNNNGHINFEIDINLIRREMYRVMRALRQVRGPVVSVVGSHRVLDPETRDTAREISRRLASQGVSLIVPSLTGIGEAVHEGYQQARADYRGVYFMAKFIPMQGYDQEAYIGAEMDLGLTQQFVRKTFITSYSDIILGFPGGVGTLDTLMEALTLVQTGKVKNLPVIPVGRTFWKPWEHLIHHHLADFNMISKQDTSRFRSVDTTDEIEKRIHHIYQRNAPGSSPIGKGQAVSSAITSQDLPGSSRRSADWQHIGQDIKSRAQYRKDIEQFFEQDWAPDGLSSRFLELDRFKVRVSDFVRQHPVLAWLDTTYQNLFLKQLHARYLRMGRQEDWKEHFVSDMVLILDLAANIQKALREQIRPDLAKAGLEKLYTNKIAFISAPQLVYPMTFMKGDILGINVERYLEDQERAETISALRFAAFYSLIYRQQVRDEDALAKKEESAHSQIADKFFQGFVFDRSIVRETDRPRLTWVLAKVVALWGADALSDDKNMREDGIRRRMMVLKGRPVAGDSLVVEIAAHAAVAEVTGYPMDDETLGAMVRMVKPEDTAYYRRLKEEFEKYFLAVQFKNDFSIKIVSQEEFNREYPDSLDPFYYARSGHMTVVVNNAVEILAREAMGRQLHQFHNMLAEVPAVVQEAARVVRADPSAREALEQTLGLMGSRDPVKRANDLLAREEGQFDNVLLEGKEEVFPFVRTGGIKRMFDAYFRDHDLGVFIFKYVPGGKSMFVIDTPDSELNTRGIRFTLRGFIQKSPDGTYEIAIQGHDTRDPFRFLAQHGLSAGYARLRASGKPAQHMELTAREALQLAEITQNEMIMAARRLMATGLNPDTKVLILHKGADQRVQGETIRLMDLARDRLRTDYIYPVNVNPDYVPHSIEFVLGQMLARYNYLKVKKMLLLTGEKRFSAREKYFMRAVESMESFPYVLEALPLFEAKAISLTMRVRVFWQALLTWLGVKRGYGRLSGKDVRRQLELSHKKGYRVAANAELMEFFIRVLGVRSFRESRDGQKLFNLTRNKVNGFNTDVLDLATLRGRFFRQGVLAFWENAGPMERNIIRVYMKRMIQLPVPLEKTLPIFEHAVAVALLAEALARGLGLNKALVGRLRLVGLVHDLQKLESRITVELHNQPLGVLSQPQWQEMRSYTRASLKLLEEENLKLPDNIVSLLWDSERHRGGAGRTLSAAVLFVSDQLDARMDFLRLANRDFIRGKGWLKRKSYDSSLAIRMTLRTLQWSPAIKVHKYLGRVFHFMKSHCVQEDPRFVFILTRTHDDWESLTRPDTASSSSPVSAPAHEGPGQGAPYRPAEAERVKYTSSRYPSLTFAWADLKEGCLVPQGGEAFEATDIQKQLLLSFRDYFANAPPERVIVTADLRLLQDQIEMVSADKKTLYIYWGVLGKLAQLEQEGRTRDLKDYQAFLQGVNEGHERDHFLGYKETEARSESRYYLEENPGIREATLRVVAPENQAVFGIEIDDSFALILRSLLDQGPEGHTSRPRDQPTYPNINPQSQFVDLASRLGVWQDSDGYGAAIDHAALASQRTGKVSFLEPLLKLGILDTETGEEWFCGEEGVQRKTRWYAWGFVEEAQEGPVRLRVTVTYAKRDVLAVKVELENLDQRARPLALRFLSEFAQEDQQTAVQFHARKNIIFLQQLASPTEPLQFKLRDEPMFYILTAVRPSFPVREFHVLKKEDAEKVRGYAGTSRVFTLEGGRTCALNFVISSVSQDHRPQAPAPLKRMKRIVSERILRISGDMNTVVASSRRRWQGLLTPSPDVEEEFLTKFRHAQLVLIRNTLAPQPAVNYGRLMRGNRGTFPARGFYEAFWIWDAAFAALGLKEWDLGLAKENIRLVLANQGDDGALVFLTPDAAVPSAQPPLLSWAVMGIYQQDFDKTFLEEIYPRLKNWNDWWFRTHDQNQNGLCAWKDALESGWDNSPRWDRGTGHVEAVDLNAFLLLDMKMLAFMARILGREEEARHWQEKVDALGLKIWEVFYDKDSNLFFDVDRENHQRKQKILTPASFLPLWAGVPLSLDEATLKKIFGEEGVPARYRPEQKGAGDMRPAVQDMIRRYLLNPDYFFGEYPFPSVAYGEPSYEPGFYWRGPVWLNLAYFMIDTLYKYGFIVEADEAVQRILRMVNARPHIYEYYNSQTGCRGEGPKDAIIPAAQDFSWSAALMISILLGRFNTLEGMRLFHEPVIPAARQFRKLIFERLADGKHPPAECVRIIIKLANLEWGRPVKGRVFLSGPEQNPLESFYKAIGARAPPQELKIALVAFSFPPVMG